MPLELTPEGRQAYAILAAAQADPGRIGEAQRQIGDLAAGVTPGSQALREVQDAGTILHRLAGTVAGQIGIRSGTISAQAGNGPSASP